MRGREAAHMSRAGGPGYVTGLHAFDLYHVINRPEEGRKTEPTGGIKQANFMFRTSFLIQASSSEHQENHPTIVKMPESTKFSFKAKAEISELQLATIQLNLQIKQLRKQRRKDQRQKFVFRFEALDVLRQNLFAENGLPNQTQESYMDRLKDFKFKLEKQVKTTKLMEKGAENDKYIEKIENMIGDVNQKIMMEMKSYVEDLNATISAMSLEEEGIDQSGD